MRKNLFSVWEGEWTVGKSREQALSVHPGYRLYLHSPHSYLQNQVHQLVLPRPSCSWPHKKTFVFFPQHIESFQGYLWPDCLHRGNWSTSFPPLPPLSPLHLPPPLPAYYEKNFWGLATFGSLKLFRSFYYFSYEFQCWTLDKT